MAKRSATLDELVRYITAGYFADQGDPVRHHGPAIGKVIDVDISALPQSSQQLARWAMEAWESVADVRFNVTTRDADIRVIDTGDAARVTYETGRDGELLSAVIDISAERTAGHGTSIDGYGFHTYLHEFGHVLGLGHAGDYDGQGKTYHDHGTWLEESWQLTLMSYFGQDENPHIDADRAAVVMPMPVDVMAVRKIWGAAKVDYTAGDTVWGIGTTLDNWLGEMFKAMKTGNEAVFANNRFSLYIDDTSGHDRLDFSHDGRQQIVDLTPGSVLSVMGVHNNIQLSDDTLIEDYRSGGGADRIRGNGVANELHAGRGEDRVLGRGGNDRILGEEGDDTLLGHGGHDRLIGGTGGDLLVGAAGNDRLIGEGGEDRLRGGAGNDLLDGGEMGDVLLGQAGDDRLFGGLGTDRLVGGGGDDLLEGGDAGDDLFGGAGRDTLSGGGGQDRILGGGHHDVIEGGDAGDTLLGQAGNDRLFGDEGIDVLDGGAGRDRLAGGEGADTFTGGGGHDSFVFDGGTDTITDFTPGVDRILLDVDAIWGAAGAPDSLGAFLERPRELDGETMLYLAEGARLVLVGIDDTSGLGADIGLI